MSLDILKENIKKGMLSKVYLFWGPEDYLIRYYLGEIESRIVSPEFKNLNYVVFKGREPIKDIISTCETSPMMSGGRMVVVKNSELFSDSGAKKGKDAAQEADKIFDYLKDIPEGVCLAFVEDKINKKSTGCKAVEKNGVCVEFGYQKPPELIRWVAKAFSSYNVRIRKEEAEYLVNICEPGMDDILNEIKKLVDYVGECNEVTKPDIDSLCIKSVQSKVFDMIDSITNGNPSKAYNLLNDMIYLKEPIQKISVLVARHFKIMFFVKQMSLKGYKQEKIASELSLNPYIAGKYIKQAGRYGTEILRAALNECLEIDRRTKTGRTDPRTALEAFIAKYSV